MKVGVLETGAPPGDLQERFGRYPQMFETLLAGRDYAWSSYDVRRGVFPARPDACDAYIITGSAAGAYDPEPWIGQTEEFLRAAKNKTRLIGVCFGHQLMAQAFGGKVIKSPKGWAIGLQRYEVERREPWIGGEASVASAASHQDQVVELPPNAQIVAGSDFTPMGVIAYTDQSAISIQLHPEFAPDYAKALIGARRERYEAAAADAALASYDAPDDRPTIADWFARFIEG
jgi:GMP synthase-like glutamine amidotransferase